MDAQVAALDGVRADAALEDRLRRGADATFRAFGSGGGLERYWRLAVEGLNEHFRAAMQKCAPSSLRDKAVEIPDVSWAVRVRVP